MPDSDHIHHYTPTPTGEYVKVTDWVDGKQRWYNEPVQELRCKCGKVTKGLNV